MQKFAGSGEDCKYPTGKGTGKLQQSAEKILKKVQAVLLKPEVKQAGKEQIKKKPENPSKRSWRKANWTLTGRTGSDGNVRGGSPRQKTGYGIVRHLIFYGNRMPFALFGGGRNECI